MIQMPPWGHGTTGLYTTLVAEPKKSLKTQYQWALALEQMTLKNWNTAALVHQVGGTACVPADLMKEVDGGAFSMNFTPQDDGILIDVTRNPDGIPEENGSES